MIINAGQGWQGPTVMRQILIFLLSCFSVSAVDGEAKIAPSNVECSGRLMFKLPSDSELPGVPVEIFQTEMVSLSESYGFRFEDNERAGANHFFVGGPLIYSHELSAEKIDETVRIFLNTKPRRNAIDKRVASVSHVADLPKNYYGLISGGHVNLLLRSSSRLYSISINSLDGLSKNVDSAKRLASSIQPRIAFSLPAHPAICLPELSLSTSDFSEMGEVSSLFRLKAHPDVTILVSDTIPLKQTDIQMENSKSPKNAINGFWGQYELQPDVQKIDRAFPLKNGRGIKLANQEGIASYVRITRKDGTIDYGYYASSHGNWKDRTSSDIAVYVITRGSVARSKGLAPVNAEAFLKISEDMQESISFMIKP